MTDVESKAFKRTIVGKVVSDKMDKTVVVSVVRQVRHKLYKKYIKVSKKFKAHDANNECRMGDVVRIVECRPLSKSKTWMLEEIVERGSLS